MIIKFKFTYIKYLIALIMVSIIVPMAWADTVRQIVGFQTDSNHNLVVTFDSNSKSLPPNPSMLQINSSPQRLVIEFRNCMVDDVSMPTTKELSQYFDKIFNGINEVNYSTIDNSDEVKARLTLYHADYITINPQIIAIDLQHVVIGLNAKLNPDNVEGVKTVIKELPYKIGNYPYKKYDKKYPASINNINSSDITQSSESNFKRSSENKSVSKLNKTLLAYNNNASVDVNSSQNGDDKFDFGITPSDTKIMLHLQPKTIDSINNSSSVNSKSDNGSKNLFNTETSSDNTNQAKVNIKTNTVSKSSSGRIKVEDNLNLDKSKVISKNNTVNALTLYNKAVELHMSQKLNEAKKYYQLAIEANPNQAEFHSNLGILYNQQFNYPQALIEFNKAYDLNPNDALTFNGIAATLKANQDYNGAIVNFKKAIKLDPKLVVGYVNLASCYENTNQTDRAIYYYDKTISLDPKLGDVYYHLGLLYLIKNDNEMAKKYFKDSLKFPSSADCIKDAKRKLSKLEK